MPIYGIVLLRPWHFAQNQATCKEDLLTVHGMSVSRSDHNVVAGTL